MNTQASESIKPNILIRFFRGLFSWRTARRLLMSIAVMFTLVALFYVVENWRGKHAWNNYRQKLEAEGFRVDITSYVPAPVPDDQNFAAIPLWQDLFRYETNPVTKEVKYRGFESRLATNEFTVKHSKHAEGNRLRPFNRAGWTEGERINLAEWQSYFRHTNRNGIYEFPVSPQPQTPAADVLLAMSRFDSNLDTIRKAAQRPYSRFPIRYEDTFRMIVPHLDPLRSCSEVLQLRSVAELNQGQVDQALQDVCLSLRLADSVRSEPLLVGHLVRIGIVTRSIQPVWEGLADHKWSDSQLATLDRELAKMDFLADYHSSMRGEIAYIVSGFEYIRETRDFGVLFDSSDPNNPDPSRTIELAYRILPSGWFYQNELTTVRMGHDAWFSLVDTNRRQVFPSRVEQATQIISQAVERPFPYNYFSRRMFPSFEKMILRFAWIQVSVDEARIACALERYRLANGSYPETLAALTPKFLEKVPHDIMTGQPLIYKRTANGEFELYSVGWNVKDDGGNDKITVTESFSIRRNVRANREQGDWVWPNAAENRQLSR